MAENVNSLVETNEQKVHSCTIAQNASVSTLVKPPFGWKNHGVYFPQMTTANIFFRGYLSDSGTASVFTMHDGRNGVYKLGSASGKAFVWISQAACANRFKIVTSVVQTAARTIYILSRP